MEAAQTSHRMDIIVNKRFEVEPFLDALDKCGFLTAKPEESYTPPANVNRMANYRRRYCLGQWEVIIRCIEDILPPNDPAIVETSGSHSQMKAMLLPGYIRKDKPEVIFSVSTAESTPHIEIHGQSQNGSVVLGNEFYIYDARELDPTSPSRLDVESRYIKTKPPEAIRSVLFGIVPTIAPRKFQTPPHSPAGTMQVMNYPDAVSVGIVNVVHYEVYEKADPVAYEAAKKALGGGCLPACLETTHGIVAASAGDIPTIFISPITDRYTKFAEDVDDKQNYVAGYNAGVTTAAFLDFLGKMR